MQQVLSKSFTAKLTALKSALDAARNDLSTAGKLLVEMLDENEHAFEILIAQGIARLPLLEALEQVGRGLLDPLLLTNPCPAAQRAIGQGLPIQSQRQLMNGFMPVAVKNSAGGVEIRQKKIEELTLAESYRLIGERKLRSAEEQTQLLKTQIADRARRDSRFELMGDRIRFFHDTEFSLAELETLLAKSKEASLNTLGENMQHNTIKSPRV